MIDKLRSLLGDDEVPPAPDEMARDVVNAVNGGWYITTETVRKGDASRQTVAQPFVIDGNLYEQGGEIAGVKRAYDGSITDERNVHNYISDHGEMPVDDWTGNPSPDHLLHAIAIVPGEFIQAATADEYLAVPYWEDEAV